MWLEISKEFLQGRYTGLAYDPSPRLCASISQTPRIHSQAGINSAPSL